MRVKFARYGGIAAPAMQCQCEVDTTQLPEAEADRLNELVRDFRTSQGQATTQPEPNARDAFFYELEIESETGTEQMELSDSILTGESMQLVEWLVARAQSASGD